MYADILTLYFGSGLQPAAWQHLLSGQVGSRHITQGIALLGAFVLETAVVMSIPDPLYANLFCWFFAVIEIACSAVIVWYAWTWRSSYAAAAT